MSSNTAIVPGRWGSLFSSVWLRVGGAFAKLGVNKRRALRLCESLSLGEKRIVAIIECDRQRFLLAATPQSISLLQSLGPVQDGGAQEK